MTCPKCCRPVHECVCSPLDEAAALRKRVEELESRTHWPGCEEALMMAQLYADEAQDRREKAERRMEEEFQIAQQERRWRDEVQADLDAALTVITEANRHSAVRLQDRMCSEGSIKAWRHVAALLEKRREENRG